MRLLMKLYLDAAHTVVEFLSLPCILASFFQLSKKNFLDVYNRRILGNVTTILLLKCISF